MKLSEYLEKNILNEADKKKEYEIFAKLSKLIHKIKFEEAAYIKCYHYRNDTSKIEIFKSLYKGGYKNE